MMFIAKMNRKRETSSGRYRSPFTPIMGREIWSRMKRTTISKMLCFRLGTMASLRVVHHRKNATRAVATTSSTAYLVMPLV